MFFGTIEFVWGPKNPRVKRVDNSLYKLDLVDIYEKINYILHVYPVS